ASGCRLLKTSRMAGTPANAPVLITTAVAVPPSSTLPVAVTTSRVLVRRGRTCSRAVAPALNDEAEGLCLSRRQRNAVVAEQPRAVRALEVGLREQRWALAAVGLILQFHDQPREANQQVSSLASPRVQASSATRPGTS